MVIKKLNNFFHKHSKVVLGVFALLIIFAFVISDNLPAGGGCSSPTDNPAGTVFGEEVTIGDMQQLYKDYALFCQLSGMQIGQFDAKNMLELKALLKRAEDMGISLSDKEVADMIKNNPAFFNGTFSQKKLDDYLKSRNMTMEILVAQIRYQAGSSVSDDQLVEVIKKMPMFQEGGFSAEKYDEFLKKHGLTDKTAGDLIRRFGAVLKMRNAMLASVVVSDEEVKAYYMMNAMDFELCTFKVPTTAAVPEPKDEDLKKLYEENKMRFASPMTYKTVSAVIPMEKFKDEAAKNVTDDMVVKARMVNPGKSDAEIKEILIRQRMESLASIEATRYIREVYEKVQDKKADNAAQVNIFREWAAEKNMEFQESKETEFNPQDIIGRMVMQVPEKGIQLLTYPIPGNNSLMIVMVADRKAPQPKSFEECKAELVKLYKADYHFNVFEKSLTGKVDAVKKLSGDARRDGFKNLGGTFEKISMKDVMTNPMAMAVIGGANIQKIGDVSDPVRNGDSFVVVMAVKGDPNGFEAYEAEIRNLLLKQKQEALLADFQAEISRQCQVAVPEGAEEQQAPAQAE